MSSLLWPPHYTPAQSAGLSAEAANDLAIERITTAISAAHGYASHIRQVLLQLTADPDVIRYRQAVLADLVEIHDGASRWVPDLPELGIDETKIAAEGIRKLEGKRLVLLTDLELDDEIRVLPEVFDQAFGQWCDYFRIDPARHPHWRMLGLLMEDRGCFERAGLWPRRLPAFQHGYSINYNLWIYEQPSAYYRRHLLLHEGTHSFMNTVLGGCGPPWYMEGIAELLGTHRWQDARLTMAHMPANREEVPMWGRIRIVKDAYAAEQAMRLADVFGYPPHAHFQTGPYAWCWAAAALLDGHPRYRDRFRRLRGLVRASDFPDRFRRLMDEDWDRLPAEWQIFVANMEYGYDVARMAVDFTPGRPLPQGGASVRVAADRGWQNSGLELEAGVAYRIAASGRYQLADEPRIWWSEPGGVSIRYYHGLPLGILLAAVQPAPPDPTGLSPLVRPTVIGLGATLTPAASGTLFLRINDSAAELADNAGELTVRIMAKSR